MNFRRSPRGLGSQSPAPISLRPTRQSRAGFTLVEIAVAVAILGLALGTLLSLHTGYLSAALRDKNTTRGALVAKQLMTLVEVAEAPPDPGVIDRDLFETLKDSGLIPEDEEAAMKQDYTGWMYHREVSAVPIMNIEDVLRRIDIKVSWGDDDRDSYTLTYFMRTLTE